MFFLQGTIDIANMLAHSEASDMVYAGGIDVLPIGFLKKSEKIAAIFAYLAAKGAAFFTRAEFRIDGGSTI